MQAGKLNRRIALQRATVAADSEGFTAESWSLIANVWAYINPAGGTEQTVAGQTEEKITHRVTIRYRADTSAKQRFVYNSPTGLRIFLIHSLLDQDEAHRELDCMCEEIVTSALTSA